MNPFEKVTFFEQKIADYYNAPYAVAVDCCTHGLELALRYTNATEITVPNHTYLSIPMLSNKLNIKRNFTDNEWVDYYYITDTIIDSAVYWKKSSYIKNTYMVLSFQYQKHLSLGRGGMILTDNKESAHTLRCMAYDGRDNTTGPWIDQEINNIGYHYYMTPETADNGINKLASAISTKPKQWSYMDYPNLTNFEIFNNG